MANTFKNAKAANVGVTSVLLYTAPASTATVTHGIFITNKTSNTIKVSLLVGTYYVLYQVSVKPNSTVIPNKPINMMAGETLNVITDTATSCDVFVSLLEIS